MFVRPQSELAHYSFSYDAASCEQPLFGVMEQLSMLQAENNLGEKSFKDFVGLFHPVIRGELKYFNEQIRDGKSRHHLANAGRYQVQHVHAAPPFENAESTICRFQNGELTFDDIIGSSSFIQRKCG